MFKGFSPRAIDFMWNLRLNSEKSWFDAHKDAFQRDFQLPMRVMSLYDCLVTLDSDPALVK